MKKQQYQTKQFNKTANKTSTDVKSAVEYLKANMKGNFDHTLECQIALNLPAKNKKDAVRFSIVPMHSYSKAVKILVLAEGADAQTALKEGADYAGLDELVEKITSGWSDFDVVIATPAVMPKIAKLGRVLGPKGLMPNPKTETVTNDLAKVISNYKKGKLDFKMAESNQIAFTFGKLSMDTDAVVENYEACLKALNAEVEKYGQHVLSKKYIKTTMSPAIKIA